MRMISVLLLLCLSAICNAELRTWTAVNGKEVEAEFVSNEKGIVKLKLKSGKVFEVPANKLSKEDNEFISSLAKPEGVNAKKVVLRENIYYLKGSETPYTGRIFLLHDNEQMSREGYLKEGKQAGTETHWYKNGKKRSEVKFKDGKRNGLMVGWHENGKKAVEANFKDGELISEKYWNSKGEPVDSFLEAK